MPLSLVIIVMLPQGYALYPSLTATVAGLAVVAATLLNVFHPHDVTVDDLIVHGCAVLIVVGANQLFGNALLRREGVVRLPR